MVYKIPKYFDGTVSQFVGNRPVAFITREKKVMCYNCVRDNLHLCEDPREATYYITGHIGVFEAGFECCRECGTFPWLSHAFMGEFGNRSKG